MELPVNITPTALRELKRLVLKEKIRFPEGIRITHNDGNYKIGFDTFREGDLIFSVGGFKLYIRSSELQNLQGVKVDFYNGLHRKGFYFEVPKK